MTSRSSVVGRRSSFLIALLISLPLPCYAQKILEVHGRQYILQCGGPASGPVVMLLPGGSGTVEAWQKVQDSVVRFARVCSYEPASAPGRAQDHRETMDEMATDLSGVLDEAASGVPAILVGHSAGGILARRFAEKYPQRVAGFVLLDSSHEEQMWRFAAIAPSLLDFGFGKNWKNPAALSAMGLLPSGQRSGWHTDRPLLVLEHTVAEPPPPAAHVTPAQAKQVEAAWQAMQQDLAARSPRGELRRVEGAGSEIHRQRPGAVTQAIRDVLNRVK